MNEEIIKQFKEKISNVQHKYCGTLDENGFRLGTSCQQWFSQSFVQEYSGQFLYNNIQNKGIYLIDKKGDQAYYDGLFFCNKLEGYGKVIYANSTAFEGLFKQHTRFGPGVLTHSDSTQDVGMWDGCVLRRIIVSISSDVVPRLGKNSYGKARLLKFRNFVPVRVKTPDPAKDILSQLTDNEEILAQSDQLYNLHVRNPESLFFNKKLYYSNFAKEDSTIDVTISQEEFEECSFRSQTLLESESVTGESAEDISFECSCFQSNLDRFGHMCMQLNEVEVKLERLTEKRNHVKQQLLTCKYCCKNMPCIHELEKIKTACRRPRDNRKKEVQKNLTFQSSSHGSEFGENEFQNNPLHNEIELKNYFYSEISLIDADEETLLQEKNSKVTLPFGDFFTSKSDSSGRVMTSQPDSNYGLGGDSYSEEYEQTDFIAGFPTCLCNQKLIENIHILQQKFESLIQEEIFYTTIKDHLKNHVDLEFEKLNRLDQEENRFFKKVVITDLLAWNNEEIWATMLKHCFRHRSSEENVSFTVRDLLIGQRHLFRNPGIYETNCTNFLKECIEGNETKVLRFIRSANVNPDLCDARGNTGIMLATIRNKTKVIKILTNCGAKLDVMNDEGLTPLSVAFLKYLSFKFRVNDWEKAFLSEVKPISEDFQQWCPTDSLISIYSNLLPNDKKYETPQTSQFAKLNDTCCNISVDKPDLEVHGEDTLHEIDSKTIMMMNSKNKQTYVFNLEYIYVLHKESKTDIQKKTKKTNNLKSEVIRDKIKNNENDVKKKQDKDNKLKKLEKEQVEQKKMDEEVAKKLMSVKNTILTLLNYGSDPNIGEVPLKPIFLAVFTDDSDFMYGLLKNKADPDTVMLDGNLTSLHIIVSLNPTLEKVRMCEILLNFDANPNLKTDVNHWPDIGRQILGVNLNDLPNECKNALHILSVREDFIYDSENFLSMMASILVFRGCKANELYLGHTPLSLAVLRGNIKLIEFLLDTGRVDPHQLLGNGMGNALTVLILNRFITSLPAESKNLVATALIDNGLNPLNKVSDFENVIAFMEYEEGIAKLSKLSNKMVSKPKRKIQEKQKNKRVSKSSKKSISSILLKKASSRASSGSLKTKSKSSSKKLLTPSSKLSKKEDRSPTKSISVQNHIIEISRKILFRHIKAEAVANLYTLVLESLVADPVIGVLANLFTPMEALNIIDLLFQYGKVSLDKLNYIAICNFLTFIKIQRQMDPKLEESELEQIDQISKLQSTKKVKQLPPYANFILPEVDEDVHKYKICYYCLQSEGKKLLKCPGCELVYFCSEECNDLSCKFDEHHYCKVLFYNAVSEIMGLTKQPSRLGMILDMANTVRKERMLALKFISAEDRKLTKKLKSTRNTIEITQITNELEQLEEVKKGLTYSGVLWDYGMVPSSGNKHGSIKNLKSSDYLLKYLSKKVYKSSESLNKSVVSNRQFKMGIVEKETSLEAINWKILQSVIHPPTLPAISSVPTSSRKEVSQRNVDYKSTNKNISPELPDTSSGDYNRRSSPIPKSRRTSSISFAPKPRRFPYPFTNRQSPLAKIFAKTFEDTQSAIHKVPPVIEPELTPSMIIKKDNSEKAKSPAKNYYMELLSKIFADFNLPLLLLPYACYKDGQVYYRMSGNSPYFGFHKLKFPE